MLLLLPVFFLAALDWFALATDRTRLGYFSKPAVILALIAWVWVTSDFPTIYVSDAGMIKFIVFGLGLSLVGDVLLMLPQRPFSWGLIFFLFAHLCYTYGLIGGYIPNYAYAAAALLGVLVLLVALRLIYSEVRILREKGAKQYIIPLAMYILAISGTVFAGISRLLERRWSNADSYLISTGVLMLYVSDILLAKRQYLNGNPRERVLSRILYHLGQIGIAVAATYAYLRYL
ncbi:MAG: lysoplasmalogenase [Anaerolineales bacterium]|nr:lysoplasmalogenase [Anaerolineales bacterium]